MIGGWDELPLAKDHDRATFDCGNAVLNNWLARYARQNHQNNAAKTFVATEPRIPNRILGFYTLSPASVEYARVPQAVSRGLDRYEVPVFRLARLAIDLSVQGRGLGGQLLIAGGQRCMMVTQQVGGVAMLIDAKDADAARWYKRFGAIELLDASLSLILPLTTLQKLVRT